MKLIYQLFAFAIVMMMSASVYGEESIDITISGLSSDNANYNRQNEKCNFEKRKVHFLVFSGHFGRVCLTAVQSSLKRCLIG